MWPWRHYQKYGANEGRIWPGAMGYDVAVKSYLSRNPDVAGNALWGKYPWIHYFLYGRHEQGGNGNRYWADAVGFDLAKAYYLEEQGFGGNIDAWDHYWKHGRSKGRRYLFHFELMKVMIPDGPVRKVIQVPEISTGSSMRMSQMPRSIHGNIGWIMVVMKDGYGGVHTNITLRNRYTMRCMRMWRMQVCNLFLFVEISCCRNWRLGALFD